MGAITRIAAATLLGLPVWPAAAAPLRAAAGREAAVEVRPVGVAGWTTECPTAYGPDDPQKARSHKWWSSPEGRAEIGVTDAQSRDLEAIFQQMLPDLKANKADVDRYQQQLTKLLSEASAKETVVIKAIDQLEAAQSALSRTRTLMLYRMYRLLSPEQRAKVQAYYDRRAKEPDGQSVRR